MGASAVLEPPAHADALRRRIVEHAVTLFFAGPSFWGPLMAAALPRETFATVHRNGVLGGRGAPRAMFHGVKEQYGFEILDDSIGSTEALHIFISNVAGKVVPASSGFPVPGYRVELRRPDGTVIEGPDEPGMLWVAGESLCTGYWCRTDVNRMVFHGEWMRTGDTYVRGVDGSWRVGPADDVSGRRDLGERRGGTRIWALAWPGRVVGVPDMTGWTKPVASSSRCRARRSTRPT